MAKKNKLISEPKFSKPLSVYLKISNRFLNVIFVFMLACWGSYLWTNLDYLTTNEYVKHSVIYYAPLYLTNPTVLFQTVFLFLALTHDGLEWVNKHESTLGSRIRYWRDIIFQALVVPYTCFVFGMFWGLYAIDRELVFPKVYDEVIPWWFNQCVHTNILVMMVVETLLQARRNPTNEKLELTLNATVGISYAIVYYSVYFFAGRWLYNVFGIMNWWQICIFQIFIWLCSYIFYIAQFPINRLIHKEEEIEKTVSPFANGEVEKKGFEKSWSLKFRTSRSETESSKL